jgi:hypothetical protein
MHIKSLVGEGGISDHRPILLHWSSGMEFPPPPMKISQVWLEEQYFLNLVKSGWKKLNPMEPDPLMVQFATNLTRVKKSIKQWVSIWKVHSLRNIREMEDKISTLFKHIDEGPLNATQLKELKYFEEIRNEWLVKEEQT